MDSPSLRDVQQWMKRRIRPPAAAGGAEGDLLNPQRGTPGAARMAVYASGYEIRLRDGLADVYEAIRHLLGLQAFAELAREYVARHPSRVYNLTFVGEALPAFLRTHPLTDRLPFLPDVAQLEWAVCMAFHAHEAPAVDDARLSGIPEDAWPTTRLTFHPAMKLVASSWPILDLWETRHHPRESIDLEVTGRPQRVLVKRRGLTVQCTLLTAPQYQLLEALQGGASLGEACERVGEQEACEALPIATWFREWMQAGLIVGLRRRQR